LVAKIVVDTEQQYKPNALGCQISSTSFILIGRAREDVLRSAYSTFPETVEPDKGGLTGSLKPKLRDHWSRSWLAFLLASRSRKRSRRGWNTRTRRAQQVMTDNTAPRELALYGPVWCEGISAGLQLQSFSAPLKKTGLPAPIGAATTYAGQFRDLGVGGLLAG
jgi:hypothetical protein